MLNNNYSHFPDVIIALNHIGVGMDWLSSLLKSSETNTLHLQCMCENSSQGTVTGVHEFCYITMIQFLQMIDILEMLKFISFRMWKIN